MPFHIPVMAEAVVAFLAATPVGHIVDGTLGGGGHTAALAAATAHSGHTLIGVDQDPDALAEAGERLAAFGDRVTLLHGNFRDLPRLLRAAGVGLVAGILLDLGVSSHQLDHGPRGFAVKHPDAPLDMRMDPTGDAPTALEVIKGLDTDGLARLLRGFGEVRGARRIAAAILESSDLDHLHTTGDLTRVVTAVAPPTRRGSGLHPATTVFQALRIAVNGELEALDAALDAAPDLLADGGRLAVISYHSLEDRRVKHALRLGEQGPRRPRNLPAPPDWRPTWKVVTRKSVTASAEEVEANPRARSARMRVGERPARGGAA